MKITTSLLATLILIFVLAIPAHAQQQDMVNLHFQLTVTGAPCPDATYWGFFGAPNTDDVNYVQLTDPEGDGVYTGTGTHVAGRLVVQIVQGTGTQTLPTIGGESTFEAPGEPRTIIRDFGMQQPDVPGLVPHLVVNEDMAFEASVAGCPAGLPDTGASDGLPLAPLAGAMLVLAGGAYLRRRVWQYA